MVAYLAAVLRIRVSARQTGKSLSPHVSGAETAQLLQVTRRVTGLKAGVRVLEEAGNISIFYSVQAGSGA
jgi:hypothetical protein